MSRNRSSKRRKSAGSRKEKQAILLVLQGKVTEKEYFIGLRSHFRIPQLSIWTDSQSPDKIVENSDLKISRDKNAPFSKVFYVVDVDDSPTSQFENGFRQAQKRSTRNTTRHFVVSNECFEVWLLAHYEDVQTRPLSRTELSQKLIQYDAVQKENPKHLNHGFPLDHYITASKRCHTSNFNEIGQENSTAMPLLLEALIPKP